MARKSRKNINTDDITKTAATYKSWVYARISNDSDNAGESIENQIAICKDYIHADFELTFGGVFKDLGFSGTNFDRPGYLDMMEGILRGDVSCIVVKDLSRLGRTYIDVGELLFDTFVRLGIRFVSVNDDYDSFADNAGRKKLLILFKNLINHMYSRDVGKKIKAVHDLKKDKGEPAGQAPFGYKIAGRKLEIDAGAAKTVKMIFDMRLEGDSILGIARHLNRSKIPSPQQRRYQLGEISHENFSKRIVWSGTLISRMLCNETYTGALIQGKYDCSGKTAKLLPKDKWIVHENMHDAIISKEQFEEVSKLIQKSAARSSSPVHSR
jgi:DNA invertase Pin-like site-specific DNA recombinase